MKIVIVMALFVIFIYTIGFAVILWKGKQKWGAVGVLFLCLTLIVLPFFSIFK